MAIIGEFYGSGKYFVVSDDVAKILLISDFQTPTQALIIANKHNYLSIGSMHITYSTFLISIGFEHCGYW